MPRKPRAFRCVGGPHDGEHKTWDEVIQGQPRVGPRYYEYNSAGAAPFSMIYVWFTV